MKEINKTRVSLLNMSANCYFCGMIRKLLWLVIFLGLFAGSGLSQSFIKTSELFRRTDNTYSMGQLSIIQNAAVDTLIYRYRLLNENLREINGHYGMKGFRIQIYANNSRNAREESGKVRQEFISKFPDIVSYLLFENPGYFKVRVGDFRSKTEAIRLYLIISKSFPNSYLVPDFINFPDLNTK